MHQSFLFIVFNILQRREILLRTKLKVQKSSFSWVATGFHSVSPEAIARVCERISRQDYSAGEDEDERKVLKLMREVNLVTSSVPGSASSKLQMRNQIRG